MSTLAELSKMTEEQAREFLERVLWPHGPVCPRCGSVDAAKLAGTAHRPGVYKCRGCRKQFTVTVNTIFHRSHIPLRTWIMAFAIMCASKKGVSALQLQRQLGLGSYQSAWHMAHRIRHAMAKEPLKGLLAGRVEVDETYVGGEPRNGAEPGKTGRGTKKAPVLALVERGGNARAMPIERVNAKTLKGAIRENVDKASMILTDEWSAYTGIGKEFEQGHVTVNHGAKEYARDDGAHTNTVESYFALLKRGVYGAFHHVSKQHLHRYCDEFSFRWNRRKATDGERTVDALRMSEGRRLTYAKPTRRA